MADKWGRPTIEDWMGMASVIGTVGDGIRADRKSKQLSTYVAGLTRDKNFSPDVDADDFSGEAWHEAQKMSAELRRSQMEAMRESIQFQQEHAQRGVKEGMAAVTAAIETGDEKSYRLGYQKLLDAYDYIPDGDEIVPGSIDFDKNVMVIRDEITGEKRVVDIPSVGQIERMSQILYDDESFAKLGVMQAGRIKEYNNQLPVETMVNDRGQVLTVRRGVKDPMPGSTFLGDEYTRTKTVNLLTLRDDDGMERVISEEEARRLGFKTQDERLVDADIDSKEALAGKYRAETREAEAGARREKAHAAKLGAEANWIKKHGPHDTKDNRSNTEKVVSFMAQVYQIPVEQAMTMYRDDEKFKDKLNFFEKRLTEEALDVSDPNDAEKVLTLLQQVGLGESAIPVVGAAGALGENPLELPRRKK